MKFFSALIFLLFCAALPAQRDSTLLIRPERLGSEYILERDPTQLKTRAISATRSVEDVDQLPFTVWVITADEILRYGFVTLGDVLRAAPGIRVSQPGNALEGETFLMRGLAGNEYVKILINDVPVKPSAAPGMPIGAQLPIRQAERIEVMYGPVGAIYGGEACAGVVNIILKESERPVFTQADLSFGRFGYNSLDLMFGGKLGRDKSIFRFSLYGSSTVRDNNDLFYDPSLFDTRSYLSAGQDSTFYQLNPNFRATEPGSDQAKLAPIPHESRLFGINLTWRGLHFTYHRMARFDHTALGLNPLAVGWYNPSNQLAERIETFSLGFQRKRKTRTTFNTFSVVNYVLDNTSTTTYVFDRLSAATYQVLAQPLATEAERQMLRRDIYNELASEERYTTAKGLDLRFESRMTAALRPNFFVETGIQINLSSTVPANSYYGGPVEVRLDGSFSPPLAKPFSPSFTGDADMTGYLQFEYRSKRLFLVGGGALNFQPDFGLVPAPRLGAYYRIDSAWSVRANAASGYRRQPPFVTQNSFLISSAYQGVQRSPVRSAFQNAELFYGGELATRYTKNSFRGEGILFYQEARGLLREGYLLQEPGIVPVYRYGYANAPGLAMYLMGVQGLFSWENKLDISRGGDLPPAELVWRTEVFAQYCKGREWFGEPFGSTRDVRNQPPWMLQFRTSWRTARFELMLSSNRQQAALTKSVVWQDTEQRPVSRRRHPAFRTWDMAMRFNLSDHFLLYFQMQNVFNRHFAGIDATGTPDDLLYNPQPGRLIRLGVNYNMNVRVKRSEKPVEKSQNTRSDDDDDY